MSIEHATALDIGNRKRQQGGINEDSVAVNLLEDCHLDTDRSAGVFVLADGAGGARAGEIASYIATVEVTRRLTQTMWDARKFEAGRTDGETAGPRLEEATVADPLGNADAEWLLSRIKTAVQSTHTRLLQTIDELSLGSAYTTIVAGIKAGDRLYYGWVGDSRAYVVNGHPDRADADRIQLLTRDHSLVERLVQQGEVDAVEAHVHRQGNRITRALGGTDGDDPVASTVTVDTGHVQLFGDDTVVLTSDGLIDAYVDAPELHEQYERADATDEIAERILAKSVTDDEIRDVVLEADTLEAAANRYVRLANQRGGKDNISVVLFRDPMLDRSPVDDLPARSLDHTPDIDDSETIIGDPES